MPDCADRFDPLVPLSGGVANNGPCEAPMPNTIFAMVRFSIFFRSPTADHDRNS
jgi:hypothetical protein